MKRLRHDEIIEAFVTNVGTDQELPSTRHIQGLHIGNNTLYSYGTHFPLAKVLARGKNRRGLWLLNGDIWGGSSGWGHSTSSQQAQVRSATARTGIPSITIPFSALDAASIDFSSIQPIEVTKDHTVETEHVVYTQPEGSVWNDDKIMGMVRRSDEELQALCDRRNTDSMNEWERKHRYAAKPAGPHDNAYWLRWLENDSVSQYPVEVTIADITNHWDLQEWKQVGTVRRLYTNRSRYQTIAVTALEDGRTEYRWMTSRHWLGESLFSAKVTSVVSTTCKTCKGTGSTTGNRTDDYRLRCEHCHWGRRRVTKTRRATFLSGFDHEETRPLYFLCEMPKGTFTTVAEAYEGLKPETVKLAEGMGRTPIRQGDIFFAATTLTRRQLRKMGAVFEKKARLLGTNHAATEVAELPNGVILATGTARHIPEFRRPDHRMRSLGKGWYIVCKNLVPLTT